MTTQHSDTMYMAIELSNKSWKFCFSNRQRQRIRTIRSLDLDGLLSEVVLAKAKLKLPADARVECCYEAGRDGFWIHRFLTRNGISNHVIDPASVEVSRRKRRRKTDRLDAKKLVATLIRYLVENDRTAMSVSRVPSESAEDARRLHRSMTRLKKERCGHSNRIKSLLALHGVKVDDVFHCCFEDLLDWDGRRLPAGLLAELKEEQERMRLVREQIARLERIRNERLSEPQDESDFKAQRLFQLRGIGAVSSWDLTKEYFGWRTFRNRRQVGSLAGLTGTPYDSGDSSCDQGISKAGNPRIRSLMIQIAWGWIRFQPHSALTKWFKKRFVGNGKRLKRIGIVALARKLLIALWKFVEFGEIPEGAILVSR